MLDFSTTLKFLNLKASTFLGLAVSGTILLFLPANILNNFGVINLISEYRSYIGIIIIVSYVFFFIRIAPIASGIGSNFLKNKKAKRDLEIIKNKALEGLSTLSSREKIILCKGINNNERTIYLELDSSGAIALVNKKLLILNGGSCSPFAWPFTIPEFVWEHITNNKDKYVWLKEEDKY